ncbi:hypothetical protein OAH34_00545 [bacterium]|nr:hypothetical protein [bacterium]
MPSPTNQPAINAKINVRVAVPLDLSSLIKRAHALLAGQYRFFLAFCLTGILLGSIVPLGLLMGPTLTAIYCCLSDKEEKGAAGIQSIYRSFQHSADSLLAFMIMLASAFLFFVPTSLLLFRFGTDLYHAASATGFQPLTIVIAGCLLIPPIASLQMIACIPFLFTFPLIAKYNCTAVEAIKLSIQALLNNPTTVIAIAAFLLGSNLVAALLFYLPVILLIPINFSVIYILTSDLYWADSA